MSQGTASGAIAAVASLLALVFALGPAFPLSLVVTIGIGIGAVIVALALQREGVAAEFVTSLVVPFFGLALVVLPAIAIYEVVGFELTAIGVPTLATAALGITAAVAAALVFPIAAGGFTPRLPFLTYRLSGQLLGPLLIAVLVVVALDQLHVLELLPPPVELYALLVVEPAEYGTLTPILMTWTLGGILLGLVAFLFSRPLAYELLYPEERDGKLLLQITQVTYWAGVLVVAIGWSVAFLMMLESFPEISLPEGLWLAVDAVRAVGESVTINRLLVNTLLVFCLAALLASPLYIVRWVERTGARWLIRYVFSGALAIAIGLTATYGVRTALLGSETALETMDSIGDPAWTAFSWLPVILTALPLVGTLVIFVGSLAYNTLFQRGRRTYALFIAYRNVGVGALLFTAVFAQASGTPLVFALFSVAAALVAWDTFEFGYTRRTEVPEVDGTTANEFVHAFGITGVALGSAIVALLAHRLLSDVTFTGPGTLLGALVISVGAILLVFALRE